MAWRIFGGPKKTREELTAELSQLQAQQQALRTELPGLDSARMNARREWQASPNKPESRALVQKAEKSYREKSMQFKQIERKILKLQNDLKRLK